MHAIGGRKIKRSKRAAAKFLARIYEDIKKYRRKRYGKAPPVDICRICKKPIKSVLNPNEGQAYFDRHLDDTPVCNPPAEFWAEVFDGKRKFNDGSAHVIYGKGQYKPYKKLALQRRLENKRT
jgi:hypothetical protein